MVTFFTLTGVLSLHTIASLDIVIVRGSCKNSVSWLQTVYFLQYDFDLNIIEMYNNTNLNIVFPYPDPNNTTQRSRLAATAQKWFKV